MTPTEENAQEITEVETPVEEKVKKERSEAQKAVLEKARVRGLEVRLRRLRNAKKPRNGRYKRWLKNTRRRRRWSNLNQK